MSQEPIPSCPAAGKQRVPAGEGQPRRAYEPPRLEVVGSVREIVLGSLGNFPESGGGFVQF